MLQTGVLRAFGPGLRRFLGVALADRPRALLAGCVVTAALQSSTATGLMISRFVADGSVRPVPALAALLGAGIGTALVVQVLSFDLTHLAWGLVLAGAVLFRWSGAARRRDLGRAAVGLGLMLLALHGLIAAAAPFVGAAGIQPGSVLAGARPVLVMVAAGALAWGLHSSVAVVLLAMPLAAHGTLGLDAAAAAVLGANLGTALNPVLEGAHDPAARRLSLANLLMRTCVCLPTFAFLDQVVHALLLLDPSPARLVANFHAAFNVLLAAAFVPVLPLVARGLERMLPDKPPPLDPGQPVHLRAAELDVPALAIEGAAQEALRMADLLGAMLDQVRVALHGDKAGIAEARRTEGWLDRLHTALREHLASLDPDALTAQNRQRLGDVFTFATNLERAGDVLDRNVLARASRQIKRGATWPGTEPALHLAVSRLQENLRAAAAVFVSGDPSAARDLASEKEAFRALEADAFAAQLPGLRRPGLDDEGAGVPLDLLSDFKRVNTHLVAAAAYSVLEADGGLLASRVRPVEQAPAG